MSECLEPCGKFLSEEQPLILYTHYPRKKVENSKMEMDRTS